MYKRQGEEGYVKQADLIFSTGQFGSERLNRIRTRQLKIERWLLVIGRRLLAALFQKLAAPRKRKVAARLQQESTGPFSRLN